MGPFFVFYPEPHFSTRKSGAFGFVWDCKSHALRYLNRMYDPPDFVGDMYAPWRDLPWAPAIDSVRQVSG